MLISDPDGKEFKKHLQEVREKIPAINEGILLTEVSPFLAPWVDFGKQLKGELKLITRTMTLFARVHLGPIQSGEDYEKMFKDYESERTQIMGEIRQAQKTMEKYESPEMSAALMYFAPQVYVAKALDHPLLLGTARDLMQGLLDDGADTRLKRFGQELGLYHIPIVGRIFQDPPAGCQFLGLDYEKGIESASDQFFRCMMIEKDPKRKSKNGFITLFNNIQRLFLLDFIPEGKVYPINANTNSRRTLVEGETGASNDDVKAFFAGMVKVMEETGAFTEMEKSGEKLFEAKKKLIDKTLDPILARVETGSLLAAANTFEEFSEAINQKKGQFPDLEKVDLSAYEKAIKDALEQTKSDEAEWKKMTDLGREQMAKISSMPNPKEGVPADQDPDLLKYIEGMIFQQSKQEFQGSLVEKTEEGYESARKLITEGADEKQLAAMKQSEIGEKEVELIGESLQKLEEAFTKLRNMR